MLTGNSSWFQQPPPPLWTNIWDSVAFEATLKRGWITHKAIQVGGSCQQENGARAKHICLRLSGMPIKLHRDGRWSKAQPGVGWGGPTHHPPPPVESVSMDQTERARVPELVKCRLGLWWQPGWIWGGASFLPVYFRHRLKLCQNTWTDAKFDLVMYLLDYKLGDLAFKSHPRTKCVPVKLYLALSQSS